MADGRIEKRKNRIFAQNSGSQTGRCIRTARYLYSIYAPNSDGWSEGSSNYYGEDLLYDLKKDPYELNNLISDPNYQKIREEMARELVEEMVKAGEAIPVIKH